MGGVGLQIPGAVVPLKLSFLGGGGWEQTNYFSKYIWHQFRTSSPQHQVKEVNQGRFQAFWVFKVKMISKLI